MIRRADSQPNRPDASPPAASSADASSAGRPLEQVRRVRMLHALNRMVCRGYHHVTVQGMPRVPRSGPMMIVGNHISGLDPLLIQSVIARPIVWMMAREYYQIRALKWLFDSIEAIPVSRDGKDSTALRAALRALANGRLLGVFPEGRISTTGEILPLQTGAAMIALRAGVQVQPVYQTGTPRGQEILEAIALPQHVTMRFGDPIDLPTEFGRTRDLDAPTARLHQTLRTLADATSRS